jgi:hypothetical protein
MLRRPFTGELGMRNVLFDEDEEPGVTALKPGAARLLIVEGPAEPKIDCGGAPAGVEGCAIAKQFLCVHTTRQ